MLPSSVCRELFFEILFLALDLSSLGSFEKILLSLDRCCFSVLLFATAYLSSLHGFSCCRGMLARSLLLICALISSQASLHSLAFFCPLRD